MTCPRLVPPARRSAIWRRSTTRCGRRWSGWTSEEDFSVSIETLDDVVFHDPGTDDATEKLQTKHTIDETRSLSDASSDLWKTLGNWIAEPGDPTTRLVLLAVASAGPTAALLRVGARARR